MATTNESWAIIHEALNEWKQELLLHAPSSQRSTQLQRASEALSQLGTLEAASSLIRALCAKLEEGMKPEALVAEVLHLLYPERNTTEVGLVVDIVR